MLFRSGGTGGKRGLELALVVFADERDGWIGGRAAKFAEFTGETFAEDRDGCAGGGRNCPAPCPASPLIAACSVDVDHSDEQCTDETAGRAAAFHDTCGCGMPYLYPVRTAHHVPEQRGVQAQCSKCQAAIVASNGENSNSAI